MTRRSVPKISPCDQRERCAKKAWYGYHKNRRIPQRAYWQLIVSRSGPNIKPPNKKEPVTTAEIAVFSVMRHAATETGATNRKVMASCVLPDGINLFSRYSFLQQPFGQQLVIG